MGRMKEVYIQIMNENGGIPEDMTLADMLRMKELNIYHWQEYERAQERARLQSNKQTDLGEAAEDSEGEVHQKRRKQLKKPKNEKIIISLSNSYIIYNYIFLTMGE
jgi:hypothetical protein